MEIVSDMNVLYEAFRASMKSSSWKEEPQRFEANFLSELNALRIELEEKSYKTLPGNEFEQNERGKKRHIHGNRMRDRVVRHALCDKVLGPCLQPYIIYNNGASQEGKGVDFSRRLFERDLHNYWLEYRTNDGYIAFVDLSKFYDNIRHDITKAMICPKIDPFSGWLFSNIVDSFQVDVSYMTDEEYSHCLDDKFDSIKYYANVPKEARTGEKYMAKSANIGDQTAQNIGVYLPARIDNYVTIVRGFKRYGRYMDDMYLIHPDKEYLEETLKGMYEEATRLGFFINQKKTHVCKLSDTYTYLQFKYYLTDTGKVVKRINPKSVTRQRRKLKKYHNLWSKNVVSYDTVKQEYKSWMGRYAKYMSKAQIRHMKELYQYLFKEDVRWKENIP